MGGLVLGSVSSNLSIIFPLYLRAYSQLSIAGLALPRCIRKSGLGANLVTTFPSDALGRGGNPPLAFLSSFLPSSGGFSSLSLRSCSSRVKLFTSFTTLATNLPNSGITSFLRSSGCLPNTLFITGPGLALPPCSTAFSSA